MNQPAPATLGEAGRRQLLALLEQVAAIAERICPAAKWLTLVALLSALWLAYRVQVWTDATPVWTGVTLFILSIPALICGWLWWLLVDVTELPKVGERVLGIAGARFANGRAGSDGDSASLAPSGASVGDAFRMGGSLKRALQLAWEFDSLRGVIVGVLVLANPLFLLILGVAIAATPVLGLMATVTALTALI